MLSLLFTLFLLGGARSIAISPPQTHFRRWDQEPATVTISPGQGEPIEVRGNHLVDQGIDTYLGIPYAKPPVDTLRFAPPESPDWSTYSPSINATAWKPACKQRLPQGVGDYGKAEGDYGDDEDCLYLNIFAPHGHIADDLPVMVFLHGSGFFGGAASLYDGTKLVQKSVEIGSPVIYVTVEARIGVLGFGFGWELQQRGWSNVGVRDIRLSLEWIKEHIDSFGGDPSKVTLSGQSGGAGVASFLYLQEDAGDLFRSAIIMSGSPEININNGTGQLTQEPWQAFVNVTGCADAEDSTACLQKVDADKLMDAQLNVTLTYGPYSILGALVDGDIIAESPYKMLEEGRFAKLPLLIGQTKDDGTVFVPNDTESLGSFENWSRGAPPLQYSNETTQRLGELYPADPAQGCPFGTGNETFGLDPLYKRVTAIGTDLTFTAPRRHMLECLARYNITGLWTYRFDEASGHDASAALGAYHTIDLNYLFGTPTAFRGVDFELSDEDLVDAEMTWWINFVTYTNPNGQLARKRDVPFWPTWDAENKSLLSIASNNTRVIQDTYRKEQTEFMNSNQDIVKIY